MRVCRGRGETLACGDLCNGLQGRAAVRRRHQSSAAAAVAAAQHEPAALLVRAQSSGAAAGPQQHSRPEARARAAAEAGAAAAAEAAAAAAAAALCPRLRRSAAPPGRTALPRCRTRSPGPGRSVPPALGAPPAGWSLQARRRLGVTGGWEERQQLTTVLRWPGGAWACGQESKEAGVGMRGDDEPIRRFSMCSAT